MKLLPCPVCGESGYHRVVEIEKIPVHCNILLVDKDEAVNTPKADIQLASCCACGHLFNRKFNARKTAYEPSYDASLFFSQTYQDYAKATAGRLIDRYHLRHRKILEIGCGDGRYLNLLCEMGENNGVGLDPGRTFTTASTTERTQFFADRFDRSASKYQADFIICRHVLEHLEHPRILLEDVFNTLSEKEDAGIYFEVPNANYTLEDQGIWDLIYEHYSYFTPESLRTLFEQVGFKITNLESRYKNQFLCIEAKVPDTETVTENRLSAVNHHQREIIEKFSTAFDNKCQHWREMLRSFHQRDERVALWGTGSKGVTFLNSIDRNRWIEYVIDINPGKTGKYVPGTGHKIHSPDQIEERPPHHLLIMNPIYQAEIVEDLRQRKVYPTIHLV